MSKNTGGRAADLFMILVPTPLPRLDQLTAPGQVHHCAQHDAESRRATTSSNSCVRRPSRTRPPVHGSITISKKIVWNWVQCAFATGRAKPPGRTATGRRRWPKRRRRARALPWRQPSARPLRITSRRPPPSRRWRARETIVRTRPPSQQATYQPRPSQPNVARCVRPSRPTTSGKVSQFGTRHRIASMAAAMIKAYVRSQTGQ